MKKEKSVKECEEAAGAAKSMEACEKMILEEAAKLANGQEHSAQQLLAFARKLEDLKAKAPKGKGQQK